MTNPAILEALARTILKNSNADISPTPDLPSDKNPIVKLMREWETAMSQAAAVLELVGPKPLVWLWEHDHCAQAAVSHGKYFVQWDDELCAWYASLELGDDENPIIIDPGDVRCIPSAQAAAQAHADAAHWANTQIGKLVVVV